LLDANSESNEYLNNEFIKKKFDMYKILLLADLPKPIKRL